jgi:hypothetical protein
MRCPEARLGAGENGVTASRPVSRRRAVLLFTRPPLVEARLKRLGHLAGLFAHVRDRAVAAASAPRDADLIVVGHPGAARLPAQARRLPQRGRDLGERFVRAFEDVRALGYEEIVAIGSDSPRLDATNVQQAFDALAGGARLVLGPAGDGGVYLLGVSGTIPSALREIPWGTARVFEALRSRLAPAAVLPERIDDVDGPRGLWRLRKSGALPADLARLLHQLTRVRSWDVFEGGPARRPPLSSLLRAVSWRGPPGSGPLRPLRVSC